MLEVSSSFQDENQEEMESFSVGTTGEFDDFSDSNLLENINFDDFFVGVNVDGDIDRDILPDLEMFVSEFSASYGEESEMNSLAATSLENNSKASDEKSCSKEIASKRDESVVVDGGGKGRKSSKKNSQGKRKVKVDWTPELHKRFVQAVEQLGIEKAVPSRILEIMGIHCLTRHNIASHLQKYRSHRKHLEAREAEAARWNERRYGVKRDVISPWPVAAPPTIGFPPMHHFRPLHVWGHPSTHMWPKHHSLSWPTPPDPNSFCHSQHQLSPTNPIIPAAGTNCFPQPLTTERSIGPCPLPPHGMHNVDHTIAAPAPAPSSFFDLHPSKESIDAAIEDVLSKPWLPLPLGLKAPALDSVMGELHRHGISNIPPSNPND